MRIPAMLEMLGACSFVFVSGPPDHAGPKDECTESRIAPIADTVIAVGAAGGGIALLASNTPCNHPDPNNNIDCLGSGLGDGIGKAIGALLLVPALVYAVSALHGYSATGSCRRAHGVD
jgi:hypothetical protein